MFVDSVIMSHETKTRKSSHESAKVFKVKIHVKCTNEVVTINDVMDSMKVEKLKDKIEAKTGIPGSVRIGSIIFN